MSESSKNWPTFPRWMLEEHETDIQFSAQLSTGRADEVTARIQREPGTMNVIMQLLGDAHTPLSVRIGIGVVMEDFAGSALLQQQAARLGKLSQHQDARIRADACHYLGLSGADAARPFLQACLDDNDAEVREVAKDALAELEA